MNLDLPTIQRAARYYRDRTVQLEEQLAKTREELAEILAERDCLIQAGDSRAEQPLDAASPAPAAERPRRAPRKGRRTNVSSHRTVRSPR